MLLSMSARFAPRPFCSAKLSDLSRNLHVPTFLTIILLFGNCPCVFENSVKYIKRIACHFRICLLKDIQSQIRRSYPVLQKAFLETLMPLKIRLPVLCQMDSSKELTARSKWLNVRCMADVVRAYWRPSWCIGLQHKHQHLRKNPNQAAYSVPNKAEHKAVDLSPPLQVATGSLSHPQAILLFLRCCFLTVLRELCSDPAIWVMLCPRLWSLRISR